MDQCPYPADLESLPIFGDLTEVRYRFREVYRQESRRWITSFRVDNQVHLCTMTHSLSRLDSNPSKRSMYDGKLTFTARFAPVETLYDDGQKTEASHAFCPIVPRNL
jgi:hypothetical protein